MADIMMHSLAASNSTASALGASLISILSTLSILGGFPCCSAQTNGSNTTYFSPVAGTTWNIQLNSVPDPSAANNSAYSTWDFDLADAPNSTINAFEAKGRNVICYFSAGSAENYRSDYDQFPASALGNTLDGYPNEKWVDTRNPVVRQIMTNRISLAAAKGCDGVDPDNIDGYDNNTGFNLTEDDGVNYVNFLSETAHQMGLAYGLKNGGAIVDRVVNVSQWCIQEQCHIYDECSLYQPFIEANKPVFNIEYTKDEPASAAFVNQSCNDPTATGFSVLIKHLSLDSWTETCPPGTLNGGS